ncbi:MAG: NlpC/P60 family protein [Candidatus Aminicenantales bacterium]
MGVESQDQIRADYLRAMTVDYGKHFIGTLYRWGGNDPSGFDCSGFVVEVLQGVGRLLHGRDYSANDLYGIFKSNIIDHGYAGCLAFWFDDSGKAVHVMLMTDADHVLGAVGGGSTTITAADAIRQNAFLALRPLSYRKGVPVIVDPFKEAL